MQLLDTSGLSPADLADRVSAIEDDFLLMSDRELLSGTPAVRTHFAPLLDDDEADVGVVSTPKASDIAFAWKHLPPGIASLAVPHVGQQRILIRRRAVEILDLRAGTSPTWDLLIRSALNGRASYLNISASQPIDSADTELAGAIPLAPDIDGLPQLAPSWPPRGKHWLADHLAGLRIEEQLPTMTSSTEATALLAGLWQVNDFLDESHEMAQSIQGQGRDSNGDYWHAIMHRREPDYSNGKYWFRRVGQHPIQKELARAAGLLLIQSNSSAASKWLSRLGAPDDWDAFAFVDMCQAAASGNDPELTRTAERIQWTEMLLLLRYCARQAMGWKSERRAANTGGSSNAVK